MNTSPERSHHGFLVPLCILLIGISFLAHVGYLYRVGFANADELWLDLSASAVHSHGFSEYAKQAAFIAELQGRVQYFFSWSLFLAPHFIHSDIARALLNATVHFFSLGFLAWFLEYYTSRRRALVLVALIYCLLPYARLYWPLPSFPFTFSLALLLFFFGMGLYLRSREAAPGVGWRGMAGAKPWARPVSLAAIAVALFIYEGETFCFGWIALLCLWREAALKATGFRARLAVMFRSDWPVFAAMVAFAATYIGFRLRFGSHYEGTSVTWASLTNGAAVWNVIYQFGVTGLPVVNYFLAPAGAPKFWIGHARLAEAVPFVIGNLTMTGFLKSVLGGVTVYLFGAEQSAVRGPRRPGLAIPAIALVLGFLLQAPLAVTPKYQALADAWSPYITGYFSFLCFTVCLWGLLRVLAGTVDGRPRLAAALFGILGALVFAGAAMNAIANQGVERKQEQHYVQWKLMNALFRTAVFRAMPNGSVVIAPTLWDGIEYVTWNDLDKYWTDYVRGHSGRPIQVVQRAPANSHDLMTLGRLYCAQVQRPFDDENGLLLLAQLKAGKGDDPSEPFLSNQVALIGERDYKDAVLSTVTRDPGSDDASVVRKDPPVDFRFDNGVYVARIDRPGMVADSWQIISGKFLPAGGPRFEVILTSGFSTMETDDSGDYWIWSDGANGTGVLDIVNRTGGPRTAQFATQVTTNSTQPTAFDLVIQGRPETVAFRDNEVFERLLTLVPGHNEIRFHSHGPRLAAPGDTRYLVFGLRQWRVTAK
jgi:hypothetical protein